MPRQSPTSPTPPAQRANPRAPASPTSRPSPLPAALANACASAPPTAPSDQRRCRAPISWSPTFCRRWRPVATVNVMGKWTQATGWDALERTGATVFVGNPVVLTELLEESQARGRLPSPLRFGLSGGGPVPPTLRKAFRDVLKLPLVESFGQSEIGGFFALGFPELEPDDNKLVRVGPGTLRQGSGDPHHLWRARTDRHGRRDLPEGRLHGRLLGATGEEPPRQHVAAGCIPAISASIDADGYVTYARPPRRTRHRGWHRLVPSGCRGSACRSTRCAAGRPGRRSEPRRRSHTDSFCYGASWRKPSISLPSRRPSRRKFPTTSRRSSSAR